MECIQSKDNKTIKRIISLGQRKNRQKYGEYIVEGIRSIRDIAKYLMKKLSLYLKNI